MRPVITITTDFGLTDSYVAQMKAVILSVNPDAAIVDVSHDVGPQATEGALYITQTAWSAFGPDAIHICVVDPGVGSGRRSLAIETERGRFIGPDNGVLSSALTEQERSGAGEVSAPSLLELPKRVRAIEITNERYMRMPVSATFHGRDVFAPAAAHLSNGVPLSDLGQTAQAVLAYPPLRARRDESGILRARAVYIDRFGNVITDARAADLPAKLTATLRGRRRISGPVLTYGEASGLVAIIGSGGYLELALPNGSAARELNARIGDAVEIHPAD